MRRLFARFICDSNGVTAVEYGLIVLLVVIGVVGFVASIGQSTCKPFAAAANATAP